MRPRDIHAVWTLLRGIAAGGDNDLGSQGNATLGISDSEGLARLVSIAASLHLVSTTCSPITLTAHGKSFASSDHWRLWSIPDCIENCFRGFGIDRLFLGTDSWDHRDGVIDLFAGAGGLALAFESAGFAVKAGIDNDSHACQALALNFPRCKVISRDIDELAQESPGAFQACLGIDSAEVVGIVGSPPCQGFSNIGEKLDSDPRNELVYRFFDIVLRVEPLFFVFENVPAIQLFGARPAFYTFLKRLNRASGGPATTIALALPEPSPPKVKRTLQVKKRLVSRSIKEAQHAIEAAVEDGADIASISKVAAIGVQAFSATALSIFPEVYDQEALSAAESSLESCGTEISTIAISLVVEALVRQRVVDTKSLLFDVESLVFQQGEPPLLGRATELLIEQYRSLPEIEEYRGVSVGPVLRRLIAMASAKYDVAQPCIINAADFGTPQNRERLFLVGIRKDRLGVENDIRSHHGFWDSWEKQMLTHLQAAPTASDAFGDLPDVDAYPNLIASDRLPTTELSEQPSSFAAKLRLDVLDESNRSLPRVGWSPYWEDGCKRTIHSKAVIDRIRKIGEGKQDTTSRRTRLNRSKVSHTLRAGTLGDKGSHTAVRPIHYEHDRVITVREGARLMGYPDWMTFHDSKWHGSRLVGNGVSFEMGYAIAASIRDFLDSLSGGEKCEK